MTPTLPLPGHASAPSGAIITPDIAPRLDRLRWGRFHTLVVVALGITWILDGLEVTLAGAIAPALKESPRLHFSNAEVGLVSSAYLLGAVVGALFFGWLTDRLRRKRLFFLTLALYLVATPPPPLSRALSGRHRRHRLVMESVELCAIPVLDRRGHWRGIHRHQFSDPGVDPRALPRLDRPRYQRQLLDRRRSGCGGLDRSARSRPATAGFGMARRLSHRCDARSRHLPDAHVDPGIAALADDAWPRR